jgi:hypothetical protein
MFNNVLPGLVLWAGCTVWMSTRGITRPGVGSACEVTEVARTDGVWRCRDVRALFWPVMGPGKGGRVSVACRRDRSLLLLFLLLCRLVLESHKIAATRSEPPWWRSDLCAFNKSAGGDTGYARYTYGSVPL